MSATPTFGRYAELPVDEMTPGLPASFSDPREQVVHEVAMALAGGRLVSQGLYDRAVKALGHESITEAPAWPAEERHHG